MSTRPDRFLLRLQRLAGPAVLAGLVAACSAVDLPPSDVYAPTLHYQRYPIDVAKGTVKLDVPAASARLTASQEDAVARFAQQARDNATGYVMVRRPGGNAAAEAAAGRIGQILAAHGIAPQYQVHSTYRGGKGAPVTLAFQRTFATTAECGDWPQDLARTGRNEPYANFGCSQQHNIAALVANPQDIAQPRPETPPDAMRRGQVITDYRTPKNTATPIEEAATVKVSEVQ